MLEERVYWFNHKGKKILYEDYSGLGVEDTKKLIDIAEELILKEPLNSVLYICNTEDMRFSTASLSNFNKTNAVTKPYVKAGAMIGVKGLIKVMQDGFAKISKQDTKTFNTKEEASEWLAGK